MVSIFFDVGRSASTARPSTTFLGRATKRPGRWAAFDPTSTSTGSELKEQSRKKEKKKVEVAAGRWRRFFFFEKIGFCLLVFLASAEGRSYGFLGAIRRLERRGPWRI